MFVEIRPLRQRYVANTHRVALTLAQPKHTLSEDNTGRAFAGLWKVLHEDIEVLGFAWVLPVYKPTRNSIHTMKSSYIKLKGIHCLMPIAMLEYHKPNECHVL